MAEIYLVRHGQASFGAADYDQLSPLGTEQCELLGAWFGDCGFAVDQIITGGLKRHKQSAAAFLSTLPQNLQPARAAIVDPGFDEFNHREMLQRYNPALTDLDAVKRLLVDSSDTHGGFARLFAEAFGRWIGGQYDGDYSEPWPQFTQRCNAALSRAAQQTAAPNTVVFTSSGAISAIAQTLLAFPDTQLSQMNLMQFNGGVTKLICPPEGPALSYLNNCAHLERQAQPGLITRL